MIQHCCWTVIDKLGDFFFGGGYHLLSAPWYWHWTVLFKFWALQVLLSLLFTSFCLLWCAPFWNTLVTCNTCVIRKPMTNYSRDAASCLHAWLNISIFTGFPLVPWGMEVEYNRNLAYPQENGVLKLKSILIDCAMLSFQVTWYSRGWLYVKDWKETFV